MIMQGLNIALESLWANKMRSFLSMLGIVIGVGAVIAIVSVGSGSTESVTSHISELGSNMITISPRIIRGRLGQMSIVSSQDKFTLELAEYMEKFCPSVSRIIPTKQLSGLLIFDDVNVNSTLVGTNADYMEANNYKIAQGRFINDQDDKQRDQVIVLGSELAVDLFEGNNPVGQKVKVNYQGRIFMFQIVGVMEEKGGSMAGDLDSQAYIPLSIAMYQMTNSENVSTYIAQASSSEKASNAVKELENFMVK
ncbi:MAG: ABC transporter permease, partial [Candidatus Atribacteria bacterium]|nr:ABC transporter permease [Candidatus Atribacteria bacterium]